MIQREQKSQEKRSCVNAVDEELQLEMCCQHLSVARLLPWQSETLVMKEFDSLEFQRFVVF